MNRYRQTMQRLQNKNLSIVFLGISMVCIIYFNAACIETSTSTRDQPLSENPSATPLIPLVSA